MWKVIHLSGKSANCGSGAKEPNVAFCSFCPFRGPISSNAVAGLNQYPSTKTPLNTHRCRVRRKRQRLT